MMIAVCLPHVFEPLSHVSPGGHAVSNAVVNVGVCGGKGVGIFDHSAWYACNTTSMHAPLTAAGGVLSRSAVSNACRASRAIIVVVGRAH